MSSGPTSTPSVIIPQLPEAANTDVYVLCPYPEVTNHRIASFTFMPVRIYEWAICEWAANGFHYFGTECWIKCFSCGRTIENIAHVENPASKDWHVDGCVFANSDESGNMGHLRISREELEALRRSIYSQYGIGRTNRSSIEAFNDRVDVAEDIVITGDDESTDLDNGGAYAMYCGVEINLRRRRRSDASPDSQSDRKRTRRQTSIPRSMR